MTLCGVSDITWSYFQNQWTDFDNFYCIILMRNQCYVPRCKNLKTAKKSIHVTHFGEVGSQLFILQTCLLESETIQTGNSHIVLASSNLKKKRSFQSSPSCVFPSFFVLNALQSPLFLDLRTDLR